MATEKQANEARARHGNFLVKHGAHAIGVAEGAAFGKTGFVVVAHVEPGKAHSIPQSLTVERAGKSVAVDVVTEASERFRLD